MSVALVVAGGGVTGIAWELGVVAGLRDEGVDVAAAVDLVVGTSAGATVGAQVLSAIGLDDLVAVQLADAHGEITPELDLSVLGEIFSEMSGGKLPDRDGRVRIGALALAAATIDEPTRRRVIEQRLPVHEWPQTRLVVTAVDAVSGDLAAFDAASGVGLVDAVAASSAVPGVWPPVTIGDRRYVDGGVRSVANADLAAGCDVVVVLAPLGGPAAQSLEPELDDLRDQVAHVVDNNADDEAIAAMGINPLDPAYRRPAVEHGRRQGRAAASAVGAALAGQPAG
jgi:NTE family protein